MLIRLRINFFAPLSVVSEERIRKEEEFSHACDNRDLCRFSFGDKPVVDGFNIGVIALGGKGGQDRLGDVRAGPRSDVAFDLGQSGGHWRRLPDPEDPMGDNNYFSCFYDASVETHRVPPRTVTMWLVRRCSL